MKTPKFLRTNKSAFSVDLPVYMDPCEFSQVTAIVEALSPKTCLEWGSGGSTRALLAQSPFIEKYVSVEHDAGWHDQVKQRIHDSRLSLNLVPSSVPMPEGMTRAELTAWDLRAETDASVMAQYVAFPRQLGLKFDFVLVDGRARCLCMREGFSLLRSGGVLVLHDAQRAEYQETARSLGRGVFLEPWKAGQVFLVRKP